MLTNYAKAELLDKNKKVHFYAEVNWKEDDPLTNDCKVIRLTGPDGSQAYVDRKQFLEFCFAIGDPEAQRKMVPQTISRVHEQVMKLAFKATKDIKKGQEVVLNDIKVTVPCSVVEKLGEVNVERAMADVPIIGKKIPK